MSDTDDVPESSKTQSKKSFVFLSVNVNCPDEARITELSLLAIHENELRRKDNNPPGWFPRIVDKLTVCIDSNATLDYGVGKSYNMTEKELTTAKKGTFDVDLFNILRLFLSRQSGKICFVCHGSYHLEVLQGELQAIGKSLNEVDGREVWYVDSVSIFTQLEPGKDATLQRICDEHLSSGMPSSPTAEERNIFLIKVLLKNLEKLGLSTSKLYEVQSKPASSKSRPYVRSYSRFRKRRNNKISLSTHVYLDLEATGLTESKITELCMVAVHKDSLASSELGSIPRIIDKLVLVIDPNKDIEDEAAELTKLNSQIISNSSKPRFTASTVEIIATFLRRLSQPTCLIAHNGFGFDFKVLKKHIDETGSKETLFFLSLINYADSLIGMRRFREQVSKGERQSCKLKEVFERTFPESQGSQHQAEDDAIMLLKIVRSNSKLSKWLENHCVSYSEVETEWEYEYETRPDNIQCAYEMERYRREEAERIFSMGFESDDDYQI